jgi:hypothetical protein
VSSNYYDPQYEFRKDSSYLQIVTILNTYFRKDRLYLKIVTILNMYFRKDSTIFKLSRSSICIVVVTACIYKSSRFSECNFSKPPMSFVFLTLKEQIWRFFPKQFKSVDDLFCKCKWAVLLTFKVLFSPYLQCESIFHDGRSSLITSPWRWIVYESSKHPRHILLLHDPLTSKQDQINLQSLCFLKMRKRIFTTLST